MEIETPENLKKNSLDRAAKKLHLATAFGYRGAEAKKVLDEIYGEEPFRESTVVFDPELIAGTSTKYVIDTRVVGVHNKTAKIWVSGFGDAAIFEDRNCGWFLHLEGSHEAIFMGIEKPELKEGDKIKITIEKA